MTYAGIQMFMEKLKQLINCNENPLVNNSSVIHERPQFQLLYRELGSMIQTLFIDEHLDREKVNDLKNRFTYAAEEAQYTVDMFLSHVHNGRDFNPSLNLDNIRRAFDSVKVELMKMDPSTTTERRLKRFAVAPSRRDSPLDEVIVGIDHDIKLIRDKLVQDQKKVDVVSIVGMGGIGKTTLATKVFSDSYVKHHFYVRVWVTVSQTYDKRGVLIQILESIRVQVDLEKATDSRLHEMVHKHLMGKRYLIAVDDIWHTETWDNLNIVFPRDNNGSRIMLTSRLTKVANHASSNGLIHHLGYLSKENSWELLRQKIFRGSECPEWSMKPGMQIVENCQGLPLAVVVIAGLLAKEAWSKDLWVEIAYRTGSYIVGDQNGCLETLALCYNHLPRHLKECFLYLGGFPEDYKFQVRWLIWLWVAEGFVQQNGFGNRSMEDVAKDYLMDLTDRNLVIVSDRSKSNGVVKACKVHSLVRELCLRKATEEQFIHQTERLVSSSQFSNVIIPPYKPVRMFINKDFDILGLSYRSTQNLNLRSVLSFSHFTSSSYDIAKYYSYFVLLRVLDLQHCRLMYFPHGMELLVHLRYLAIWNLSEAFPSSICNLWGLQTLIYITGHKITVLPSNISCLVNLRHLWNYLPSTVGIRSFKVPFLIPSIEKPMNLQTISNVELGNRVDNFHKCFPYIKELTCTTYLDEQNDFKSLAHLEKLNLNDLRRKRQSSFEKNHITFPETLKTLTLAMCGLPWSDMSIIQSLPNLQVLKLKNHAFEGSYWKTNEHKFPQLKFLRLEWLNIRQWEAYSTSSRVLHN